MSYADAPRPDSGSGVEEDESPALEKLAAALAKAQAKIAHADPSRSAPVTKDGTVRRKYATLADVMDAARAPLAENGLSVTQHPSSGHDGTVIVTSTLLHESGQWMRSRLAVPYRAGNMSETQALGAAITYCRRYAYAAIVGVAVEDDDAESTKEAGRRQRQEPREERTPPPRKPADAHTPATPPADLLMRFLAIAAERQLPEGVAKRWLKGNGMSTPGEAKAKLTEAMLEAFRAFAAEYKAAAATPAKAPEPPPGDAPLFGPDAPRAPGEEG